MNLAFAVHRYRTTEGTGGYVVRLATALAAEHAVTIYATEVDAPVPAGARVIRVPALRRPAAATILTFPLGFALRRGAHDLVHAQGWVTGAADVVTAHIVLAAWRRAARAAGVRPPPGERLQGAWVARREAALLRAARAVIAPSRRVAEEIRALAGRRDAITVIPHGFPDVPAAPPLEHAGCAALFVGDARKGLVHALDAVAAVPATTLAVASHSAYGPWARRIAERGLARRVRWLGPQADLRDAYAEADVLLHPTPYDTFGLVVAEAMAAGRPVIVTDRAGITELFDDRAGWIVRGDARAGTIAALTEAAADPAARAARGARARAVALGRPWSRVIAETLALYRSLV